MAKDKNSQKDETRFVTNKVRFSYVNLATPRQFDDANSKPKYTVTLLMPKSDKENKKRFDKAFDAAIEAGIDAVWKGKRPAKVRNKVHDGDGERPQSGEPFGDECKGHWVVEVNSLTKPGIVDRYNDLMDAEDIKSGDYGRVSLRAFAYDFSGSKGVSYALNNVQFLSEGESLGGRRTSPEDDFSDPFDDDDELDDLLD